VCSGGGIASGCAPVTDSAQLIPDASSTVKVIFTTSATVGQTGTVRLVVRQVGDTTTRDSVSIDVAVTRGTTGVAIYQLNPGSTVDRDLCLTISAGGGAAVECGDLRLVHVFPSVRTYNKVREPTLLYNSAHAHPFETIRADVTLPTTGGVPTTVSAVLKDSAGVQLTTGSWSGSQWKAGSTRRIALTFDASAKATGIYPYALEVTRTYPGNGTGKDTVTGEFVVINRMQSPFGPGWWLGGFERLINAGAATMLWVGGDGSARKYSKVNDSTWAAVAVNRPDMIMKRDTGFERLVPHGLVVRFGSVGQHVATVNRLSQATTFQMNAAGLLVAIVVPPTSGGRRFRFGYDTVSLQPRLRRVSADSVGGQARFDSLRYNAANQVTTFRRIDGSTVAFAYDASVTNRIISRTNQLGYSTTFAYGAGGFVTQVSVPLDASTNAVTTITPWETRGLTGTTALAGDMAYAKLDGPRTDVADTTLFWLDRFGAPRRIRNALGDETLLTRGNVSWPALVTRLQYPNGQVLLATYDGRGNISTLNDSTAFDPARGLSPTTTYGWDAKWDFVVRVVNPERDSINAAFDPASGNMLWRQDGRGDTTRVNFTYWPVGDPSGGQLKTVVSAMGFIDSLFYDAALGNLQRVRQPMHRFSLYTADAIGRVTQTVTPVDTLSSIFITEVDTLDLLDRTTVSRTFAPGDTVRLRMHYDFAGNLDTLRKQSLPDSNSLDTIKTVFGYDRANRKISEQLVGFNTITWMYDAAGNLMQGGRRPTTNRYDVLGRLVAKIGSDTSVLTYNAVGQLRTANDSAARISRAYNLNGTLKADTLRIATRVLADGNFASHVYGVRYRYDLDGRLTWEMHPANLAPTGDSARYAYEARAGLLASITDILGNRFSFVYDREARLVGDSLAAQRPDPVVGWFTYDSLSQLGARLELLAGGGPSATLHWDWLRRDARGKVVKNQQTGDSLAYKPVGHLRFSSILGSGGIESHTSDALGNQKTASSFGSLPLAKFTYTPHSDRLALAIRPMGQFTDTTYYGVLPDGATGSEQAVNLFGSQLTPSREIKTVSNGYDVERRLVRSDFQLDTTPIPGPQYSRYRRVETHRYDALGRRVWQQILRDSTCHFHDRSSGCRNEVTRTVWDGSQVLYEIRVLADTVGTSSENDNPGTSTFAGVVGYTHARDIDAPLDLFKGTQVVVLYTNWAGRFDVGTCPTTRCPSDFPYFPEAVSTSYGDPPIFVDGPPSWYGSQISGMTDGSGYQFKRNRYYDPKTGRFTQEDPIGLAGGLSAYGFPNGDPIAYSDPFGLQGCKEEKNCDIITQIREGFDAELARVENAILGLWGVQATLTLFAAQPELAVEAAPLDAAVAGDGLVTLYRAVSLQEAADISATGSLRTIAGQVEGKYFAESAADAAKWGSRMPGGGQFNIVSVQFPENVARQMMRLQRLDGIAPARFATLEQLASAINILIMQ
jgi:RHS repeat-associated protein